MLNMFVRFLLEKLRCNVDQTELIYFCVNDRALLGPKEMAANTERIYGIQMKIWKGFGG